MRLSWLLLILFQVWLAAEISLQPFDAAQVSYRHQELVAVLKAREVHPSPETQAAVQRELYLAAQHVARRQWIQGGVLIVVFLALDVGCFYGWKKFRQNRGYGLPSA